MAGGADGGQNTSVIDFARGIARSIYPYNIGYIGTTLSFCQRKANRLFERAKFDFPSGKILFPRHEQGSTFLFVDD